MNQLSRVGVDNFKLRWNHIVDDNNLTDDRRLRLNRGDKFMHRHRWGEWVSGVYYGKLDSVNVFKFTKSIMDLKRILNWTEDTDRRKVH